MTRFIEVRRASTPTSDGGVREFKQLINIGAIGTLNGNTDHGCTVKLIGARESFRILDDYADILVQLSAVASAATLNA